MSGQDDNQSQQSINLSSSPTQIVVQNNKKRKLTSVVWNEFKRIKIDGEDIAICNTCSSKLKAGHGTTSLHEHIARCKKNKGTDIRQALLQASERKKDGKVEYRTHVFDQEISRHELTSMIILHEYPLSIVTHTGFRRFVSSLQPLFKMVSRNTIKKDIFEIYDREKSKTYKLLEKIDSRVGITTDMWTSNQTKKGFMVITVHFIDESWILQSRVLRFVYVPAPHTKEVLSGVLIDSILDWNIDRKLSTITVDNCTTNDAIINILLEKLSNTSLLLDGKILHMRCCAHILNLIVKDGLDVIGDGIERIRDSVVFWTASPSRIEKFEEAARQLQISCTKRLCLDCKTRWNSTYLMLQTAIIYKDVFTRVKQRERHYTCLPTEKDWELAKEICGRLKLFHSVTELFSGTLYHTANCYFPKICDIKLALEEWIHSPDSIIRMMASKMMGKYDKYWSVCNSIMGIAVVLDPRFKLKLVEYYFPLLYGDEAPFEIQKIRQSCYDLLHEYQFKARLREGGICASSSSSSYFPKEGGVNDFDDTDPLSNFDKFISSNVSNNIIKSELDFYLEENVLPRCPNFDVLSWWKTNGLKFPTLQKIARDILAIPVSTVASEFAFSTSGRLISRHRSRLHPNTLEALMCAQSWLCNESNDANFTLDKASCVPTMCDEEDDTDGVLEKIVV